MTGAYLEPYHTHFILVDNGQYKEYKTEIGLRAKLEAEIGKLDVKVLINKGISSYSSFVEL